MASMTSEIPTAQPDRVVFGGIDTPQRHSCGGAAERCRHGAGDRRVSDHPSRLPPAAGLVASCRAGCPGWGGRHRQLRCGDLPGAECRRGGGGGGDRPDRSQRRRRGKSDVLDAVAAAEAARSGNRIAIPKSRDGQVEALRVLRLARASAVKARTKAWLLLQQLIVTAPNQLRDQLRELDRMELIRSCAA